MAVATVCCSERAGSGEADKDSVGGEAATASAAERRRSCNGREREVRRERLTGEDEVGVDSVSGTRRTRRTDGGEKKKRETGDLG